MKKTKNIFFPILLIVFGLGLAITVLSQVYATDHVEVVGGDSASGVYTAQAAVIKKTAVEVSPNFKLEIPKIKLNAGIADVGLTRSGEMAVPPRLAHVGWYKYGTVPGETGSAVIAGHYDNALGLPAVFYKLGTLEIGDDVYVTTKDGTKVHFKVTEMHTYDVTSAPLDEIFNDETGTYVKLITCSRSWNGTEFAYNKRLVVTAERV